MRSSKLSRFVNLLNVGGLTLANRVFLAPMSGVTDAPFRRLAARLGAGLVISEMTACEALAAGKRDAKLRMEAPGVGHHVVQLAGCEARWMAEGARIAAGGGAAIIDINMGCPMRHVTTGWSGSALMRDPVTGDCVYLTATGCSIHARRPAVCRRFHCARTALALERVPRRVRKILLRRGDVVDDALLARGRDRLQRAREMGLEQVLDTDQQVAAFERIADMPAPKKR